MESSSGTQATTPNLSPRTGRPVHGGIRPAELRVLGLNPEDVLDFSASVSPLGPPEGLWDALHQVDLTAYPDPVCLELREAICRNLCSSPDSNIGLDNILIGNGSTELIHLLARVFLAPAPTGAARTAMLLTPTYGEYLGACRMAGAAILDLPARRAAGFRWDLLTARESILQERPSLVFLCNPNNPTGVYLHQTEVDFLVEAVASAEGLLVLDEAYVSFVDNAWSSLGMLERGNVVLLRSMTKDYALTGLRLGYSVASANVTARLAAFQPDWSVNALAQAAGLVALADTEYLPRARAAVNQAKEYLIAELPNLGFAVLPSTANFLVIVVGDGAAMRNKLARQGLFVRDCASFGLPDCIRVGIRSLPDCQRLVEGMKQND